jgi:hypothetical protein
MTKNFELSFQKATFAVPKPNLFNFFDHRPELMATKSYSVQSDVPLDIFQAFVKSLQANTPLPVTKETVDSIALLAQEFWVEDLIAECSALQETLHPDDIRVLTERVTKLELQLAADHTGSLAELDESRTNHERQLENLLSSISALNTGFASLRSDIVSIESLPRLISEVATMRSTFKSLQSSVATLRTDVDTVAGSVRLLQNNGPTPSGSVPVPPPAIVTTHRPGTACPLKAPKSLDGIMSYLGGKCGGNVHDKGVVTITSKSIAYDKDTEYAPRNVANFAEKSEFWSKNSSEQWIRWDFQKKSILPTHYSVGSGLGWALRSWVIEGSMDGTNWTELDRRSDNSDLHGGHWTVASFPISHPIECRIIRLTQTGENHRKDLSLAMSVFEVFGTLFE